jgi:hypothetical protein
MKRRPERDYFVCPHCGADVPVGAKACRECGSDDETGWSEHAEVWGAGIPAGYGDEDDFDYDEFVARELPEHRSRTARGELARWGGIAFVVVLVLSLLWYLNFR